jgi:hypothetical protein
MTRSQALGIALMGVGAVWTGWSLRPRPSAPRPSIRYQAVHLQVQGRVAAGPEARQVLVEFPELPYRLTLDLPAGTSDVRAEQQLQLRQVPVQARVWVVPPGSATQGPGWPGECRFSAGRLEVQFQLPK